MNKPSLLLILWNIVLTVLVGWGLLRQPASAGPEAAAAAPEAPATEPVMRDTVGLRTGRIAYFHMDSLRARYELIKEKDARFQAEARKLESGLANEQSKARARYQELVQKDRTYSTQAEIEKDDAEVRQLMARLQELQSSGEERMARMEAEMLQEISKELESYLKEYNAVAGLDYIFSIQSGGQIWTGNKGLDITNDLVDGLNARHRSSKSPKK
jgi:outer membrane protein